MIKQDLLYTRDHEWVKIESDVAVVGITHYAQEHLGDIVFVELPDVGSDVIKGKTFGAVESVKAVSELFSPITGSVSEINEELENNPEWVNEEPYGKGWMIKVINFNKDEISDLLNSVEYENLIGK